MRPFLLIVLMMLANPALAGAWMRGTGTGFLSFGPVYEESGRVDGSFFIEYGLRPKLTIGAKFDADMTQQQIGDGTAFLFLRRPIEVGERSFQLAYEVGIGSTLGREYVPLILTGLSYGRGFQIGEYYGWLALDGSVEWSLGDTTDTAKLDTTVGLTLSDTFKVMVQVFYTQTEEASATTLAPSVVWQPRPDRLSFQLGIEAERDVLAVKFGIWQTF